VIVILKNTKNETTIAGATKPGAVFQPEFFNRVTPEWL